MGTPLKNPPVYFTVAQVRFNALLKLADYLPSIQDDMRRAGYPDFESRKSIALQLHVQDGQKTTPIPVQFEQFVFGNVGKTHSFVLNPETLTLQSTRYGCFEDFSATFLKGLALVHAVVKLDYTERTGLRYLDLIAPRPGDNLPQYLAPEVLGLSARLGGKTDYSFSETLSHVDDVQLRSRVMIQEGSLAFPPDLLPQGMDVEDRFMSHVGHHAILDTDGFIEKRALFSADEIDQQLEVIHRVIGTAFKQTVTPHALSTWDES